MKRLTYEELLDVMRDALAHAWQCERLHLPKLAKRWGRYAAMALAKAIKEDELRTRCDAGWQCEPCDCWRCVPQLRSKYETKRGIFERSKVGA